MALVRSYQWYRNGTAIAGATGKSYTLTRDDIRCMIEFEEKITDDVTGTSNFARKTIQAPIYLPAEEADHKSVERVPLITRKRGNRPAVTPAYWADRINDEMMNEPDAMVTYGSRTVETITSGNWSNPAIWSTGAVPGAGARVGINSGHSVLYDVESDVQIDDIVVLSGGTFKWDRSKDTKLVVDTFYVEDGSNCEIGTSRYPIEESTTLGKPRVHIVFKHTNLPGASPRFGFVSHGRLRIFGAKKKHSTRTVAPPRAGDLTLRVRSVQGWRVGDKILVPATTWAGTTTTDAYADPYVRYWNSKSDFKTWEYPYESWFDHDFVLSHDEVREITAIDPVKKIVTIDAPLAYDHPASIDTLPSGGAMELTPIVCSLSRSIKFESDNPAGGVFAHMMQMHNDDCDVRWAEGFHMGRTKVGLSLMVRSTDSGNGIYDNDPNIDGVDLGDPTNVRARYAWHAHRTGPFFSKHQIVFEGLTAWADPDGPPMPGWAIVQHSSRMAIEKCVVYNVRGAGIVSEIGDEIGQWIDNVVAWCRGDGYIWQWGFRAETVENHNGHMGVAYENQARQIVMQRNWASSCKIAFIYFQQVANVYIRVPDEHSLRVIDPITQGGMENVNSYAGTDYSWDTDTYGVEQAQIPDWIENQVTAAYDGFQVVHRGLIDRTETFPMISDGFRTRAVQKPFNLINYSFNYTFIRSLMDGDNFKGSPLYVGEKSWQMQFTDAKLLKYTSIIGGRGFNYGGLLIDIDAPDATKVGQEGTGVKGSFPSGEHPFKDIMGPWVISSDSSTYFRADTCRIYEVHRSDTDLPVALPTPGGPLNSGYHRGDPLADPLPGERKPYFWENEAYSNRSMYLHPTNRHTIKFQGLLVDEINARRIPDNGYTTLDNKQTASFYHRENYYADGTEVVSRNGCFYDSAEGVWKSRLWFSDHSRLTGEMFNWYFDVPLQGTWDSQFLTDNTVDPEETQPTWPIVPERIDELDGLPPVDIPAGWERPGDVGWGYGAGDIGLIPKWKGGADTYFLPESTHLRPDGSARFTLAYPRWGWDASAGKWVPRKHTSGSLQITKRKRQTGRWGVRGRSFCPTAVCAMFLYEAASSSNNGQTWGSNVELDFEYVAEGRDNYHNRSGWALNVWQPTGTDTRVPLDRSRFFAMSAHQMQFWHDYEIEYDATSCRFFITGPATGGVREMVAEIFPSDMPAGADWKTTADLELIMSLEKHSSWAGHQTGSNGIYPAQWEIAGFYSPTT